MTRPAVVLATAALIVSSTLPLRAQTPDAPPSPAEPAASPEPQKPRPSLHDDKRRTMKGYWNNLAYNFLGVATRGNHEPLLVTAALTAPAFAWDDEGRKYFEQHPHPDFGRLGSTLGGSIAVAGLTVGAFSAGRMSSGDRPRAATYDLSQAIIVNQVWTQALKLAIRRTRPDESNRVSFPSGHASNAFTVATVLVRHYPRLGVPGFGVATYVAVSRMAANKHHFSDIVAGAGFGYGVGRLVTRRNSRAPDAPAAPPPPTPTTLWIAPDGGPAGDGAGARLVISF
jgi:membrane-associated phospholipid phosphatase